MLQQGWQGEILPQSVHPVVGQIDDNGVVYQDTVVLALCSIGAARVLDPPVIAGLGEMELAGVAYYGAPGAEGPGNEAWVELWVHRGYDNVTRAVTIPNDGLATVAGTWVALYDGPALVNAVATGSGDTANPSVPITTDAAETMIFAILGHADDAIGTGFAATSPGYDLDSRDMGAAGFRFQYFNRPLAGTYNPGWTTVKTGAWGIAAVALQVAGIITADIAATCEGCTMAASAMVVKAADGVRLRGRAGGGVRLRGKE